MDLTFWDVIYWGTHVVGIAMVIGIPWWLWKNSWLPPPEKGNSRCDRCQHAVCNPHNFMRPTGDCRKFARTEIADHITGRTRWVGLRDCYRLNKWGQCPHFEADYQVTPPPPPPVPDNDD